MYLERLTPEDVETVAACHVCQAGEGTTIGRALCAGVLYLTTTFCTSCGLVYRKQSPTLDWFRRNWARGSARFDGVIEQRRYVRYRNLAALAESIAGVSSVLDIGSGTGTGLRAFADRGWKVKGLEPDRNLATHARGQGIDTETAPIEDCLAAATDFRLITFVHSLEHFHQPRAILEAIRAGRAQGSLLYVEVPDLPQFVNWRDALHFPHLVNFSRSTLAALLTQTGFQPIRWLAPKTVPFGTSHLGVFAVAAERAAGGHVAPSVTLGSVRAAYSRGITRTPPEALEIHVRDVNHYADRRFALRKSAPGKYDLVPRNRVAQAIRQVSCGDAYGLCKRILNAARRRLVKDREFESISEYRDRAI